MGKQLAILYETATKEFGLSARVRLAILTKMSSEQAKAAEDSAENLARFTAAMAQLRAG